MKNFYLCFSFCIIIFSNAFSQNIISGRITDAAGKAIPSVNVILKNTSFGTTANENGFYELSIPTSTGTLEFSSLGFETKLIEIN